MKEFKVIIENQARQDILSIRRYISKELKEPIVAKRIYESIKTEIKTLHRSPLRHPVVSEEPYSFFGLRILIVENYIAFYLTDTQKNEVRIIRVLYNRREWQKLL